MFFSGFSDYLIRINSKSLDYLDEKMKSLSYSLYPSALYLWVKILRY